MADFQLTYAKREWSEERASWRAVIYLNLVRNVNLILEHFTNELADIPNISVDESQEDLPRTARALPSIKFKEKHKVLKMKLGPLQDVQKELEQGLGSASLELFSTSETTAAPFGDHQHGRRALQEFSINSSNGWKSALDKFRTLRSARPEAEHENESLRKIKEKEDDIAEVIISCREDIKALWDDALIQEMLLRRKVRIEDAPGLFVPPVTLLCFTLMLLIWIASSLMQNE